MSNKFSEKLVIDIKDHYVDFFNRDIKYNGGSITLNSDGIGNIRSHLYRNDRYYYWDSLSYKNRENAQNAFGNIKGQCIGIIDTSLFKSAKTGVLFTDRGIYLKKHLEYSQHISYKELCMSIISSDNPFDYESSIHDDGDIRIFIAGKNIYELICNMKKYVFDNYQDVQCWVYDSVKDMLESIFRQIVNGYPNEAIAKAENLYQMLESMSKDLTEIVSATIAIAYVSSGEFNNARNKLAQKEVVWLNDKINEYEDHYAEYKYAEHMEMAEKEFSITQYEEAIRNYKKALKFKKTREAYEKILESYFKDVKEDNQFNAVAYETWMQRFKLFLGENASDEVDKKYYDYEKELKEKSAVYLLNLKKELPNIVLTDNQQRLIDNPSLLTVTDSLGMNIFLYAILFDNLSMIDLYNEKQLEELKKHENILGHDYLCVAAMHSVSMYVKMLCEYDDEYKSKKSGEKFRKAVNTVGYVFNSVMESAAQNAYRHYDDEEDKAKMQVAREHYGGKAENFKSKNSEIEDEMLEYIQSRYDETVSKIQNTLSNIYVDKNILNADLNSINQELNDIQVGIKTVEYNPSEWDDAKKKLQEQYRTEKMSLVENLQKDEFETTDEFNRRKEAIEAEVEKEIQEYECKQLRHDVEKSLGSIELLKQKKVDDLLKKKADIETKKQIPYLLIAYAYVSKISTVEFEKYNADTGNYRFATKYFDGDFNIDADTAKKIKKSPEQYKVKDMVSIRMNEDNTVDVIHNILISLFGKEYSSKVECPLKHTVGDKGDD